MPEEADNPTNKSSVRPTRLDLFLGIAALLLDRTDLLARLVALTFELLELDELFTTQTIQLFPSADQLGLDSSGRQAFAHVGGALAQKFAREHRAGSVAPGLSGVNESEPAKDMIGLDLA